MIPLTDTLLPLRRWLALLIVLALSRWSYAAPAPQTLTWTSPATNVVLRLNQPYPLTATASSGLPVTFRVVAGPAVINGGNVTVTNVGRLVLACEQAGAEEWEPSSTLARFNQGTISFSYQGGLNFEREAFSVQVVAGIAYVGTAVGFRTVDVRDPANPRLLGSLGTSGLALGVQVVNSIAYVAASGGMDVIDVTDPGRLSQLGTLPVPGGFTFAIKVQRNHAFLAASEAGLWIVDVSQPDHPKKVGVIAEPFLSVRDVEVKDEIAYVAFNNSVIRAYNVSDPVQPVLLASFGNPALTELAVNGRYAYAADGWRQFTVWDVQNPDQPIKLGSTSYLYGQPLIGFGIKMIQAGGFAYVTGIELGLRIFDIGDPQFPVDLGIARPTSSPVDVFVEGDRFYVAGFYNGLSTFLRREVISQQIEFSVPATVPITSSRLELKAVASSGLPVSLSIVSGPAILEGNTLVATGPGIVTISAEQGGGEQFAPAKTIRSLSFVEPEKPLGWGVDPSLQLDLKATAPVSSVIVIPDGKLLIAVNGAVIRLFNDGTIDDSFTPWLPSAFPRSFASMARLPNGEILVASKVFKGVGPVPGPQFPYSTAVDVLGPDGQGGRNWAWFQGRHGLFVQRDGKFLVGGSIDTVAGTGHSTEAYLARFLPDLAQDPAFVVPPALLTSWSQGALYLSALAQTADNGLILGGSFLFRNSPNDHQANTPLVVLNADGSLRWKHTLDPPAWWLTGATFVAEVSGGRIVEFPTREVFDGKTGARLGTFPIPPEVIATTSTYFQEPDGRLILSGTFTNYAGIPRRGLAAVFPDGSLDLSFDPGLGTTNAFTAIARQADGALLLAGPAGTFDGISHRGLIRLVRRNPAYVPPTKPSFYLVGPGGPLDECGYAADVHVVRSGVLTGTNRVRLRTESGTATAGIDFTLVDRDFTFLPGDAVKSVELAAFCDLLLEGPESFQVSASIDPNSVAVGSLALPIQITDVNCRVSFDFPTVTLPEAGDPIVVAARTTEYPPPGFTLRLRTRDVSAIAGEDYVGFDWRLFGPSLVTLQARDNPTWDGQRQFVVEAYDPRTGQPLDPNVSMTVTITDDDTLAGPYRGMAGNLRGFAAVRDGWLMVGDFSTVDGRRRPGLARFTLGGDLDHTFEPPAELAGQVVCAAGTPDGGVLLGENFNRLGTWLADGLVRLNSAGQLDAAFEFRPPFGGTNCSTAANQVRAILLEPDGSSFLAGSFPAFFGCDPAPRLLRLSPAGQVEASWLIPDHKAESGFAFTGNGHGRRILQGNAGVFAVEVGGLTRLSEVDLGYGAPLAVLPDGGLAGLSGNTLVLHAPDGSVRAEVNLFRAEDDVWTGWQLHTVALRQDGRLLVSGVFQSTTQTPASLRVLTLALEPSALATGQVASGEKISLLRLAGMVAHPEGPLAALNVLSYQQAEPKWWRLDPSGRPVSDLEFSRMVMDGQGQFHLALRGQAPDGYTVEVSDDLDTWTEWFKSAEINWGQTFLTPPLPAELPGRYFRLRL